MQRLCKQLWLVAAAQLVKRAMSALRPGQMPSDSDMQSQANCKNVE